MSKILLQTMLFALIVFNTNAADKTAASKDQAEQGQATEAQIKDLYEKIMKELAVEDMDTKTPLIEFTFNGEKHSLNFFQIRGISQAKYKIMNAQQKTEMLNKAQLIKMIYSLAKHLAYLEENKAHLSPEEIKDAKSLTGLGLFDFIEELSGIVLINSKGGKEGVEKEVVKYLESNSDLMKKFSFIAVKADKEKIAKLQKNIRDQNLNVTHFKKYVKEILGASYNENNSTYKNLSIKDISMKKILDKDGIKKLLALEINKASPAFAIDDQMSCIIYLVAIEKKDIEPSLLLQSYLNQDGQKMFDKADADKVITTTSNFEKIFGTKSIEEANKKVEESLMKMSEKMLKMTEKIKTTDKK